jgi:hypothetical protein
MAMLISDPEFEAEFLARRRRNGWDQRDEVRSTGVEGRLRSEVIPFSFRLVSGDGSRPLIEATHHNDVQRWTVYRVSKRGLLNAGLGFGAGCGVGACCC